MFYNFVLSDIQDPLYNDVQFSLLYIFSNNSSNILNTVKDKSLFFFYPQMTPQIYTLKIYLPLTLVHPLAVFLQNNQRDACRLFYLSAFCGIVAI